MLAMTFSPVVAIPESATRTYASAEDAFDAGVMLCCVPYWDAQSFFRGGGRYTEGLGYHAREGDDLSAIDEWLPRKWQYRGDPPAPVLLPDMLPTTSWEANLRTALRPEEWDRLRKFCYQAAGYACVACGSRGEPHVEAHESWSFNEKTGVQKLKGLLCLCPTCHKAKHLGYANRIGKLPQVLARLKWLNAWDEDQLQQGLADVENRQQQLSTRAWTLDLSFLASYGVR